MALFNHQFPYTNLHDLNLDWIIKIIKSIDPAVIRALQELSPDIIEQVNQKVAEAQAAAIAAQSSASEANTAKDEAVKEATEAAADAALANADAVRAEAAKTAVENSLAPSYLNITSNNAQLHYYNAVKSGRFVYFYAWGTIQSLPETDQITLAKIEGSFLGTSVLGIKLVNNVTNLQFAALVGADGGITAAKDVFAIGDGFAISGTTALST